MVPKTLRFDETDIQPVEKAAALEGIDFTSYCRRCIIMYTREHHPEVFPSPKPRK